MGYVKEKYTKEYYTGFKKKGFDVVLGATSVKDEDGKFILREHDKNLLSKINFEGKRVLELGFGRGEAARYVIDKGASSYKGVDFSEEAYAIAVKDNNSKFVDFYCDEALDFIKKISAEVDHDERQKFDVLIMFDFIEHVPRSEVSEVLIKARDCLQEKSIVVINTPAYKFDNDVIKDGFDERNTIGCLDLTDVIPETRGMHCNKFSKVSLAEFMKECGYKNITMRNYYIKSVNEEKLQVSYKQRWSNLIKRGFAFQGEYKKDEVEYPYTEEMLGVFSSPEGINILTTETYFNTVFKTGYDNEIFEDFRHLQEKQNKDIIVFDVGGFIGLTAMLFAKLSSNQSKIVCFEPNLYNKDRILDNLALNPALAEKIQVCDWGLSDSKGIAKMLLSSNIDSGYSSTSRIDGAYAKISKDNLPASFYESHINLMTLDDFVEETGLIPDLIKVDIEGAEHLLLYGALELIKKHHPFFYIEYHSEYCSLKCTELLAKSGYELEVLKEEHDNRITIKASYNQSFGDSERRDYSMLSGLIKIQKDEIKKMLTKVELSQSQMLQKLEAHMNTVPASKTKGWFRTKLHSLREKG